MGVGRVKPPIHFHCVLLAKRGWVEIACKIAYVLNGRSQSVNEPSSWAGDFLTCFHGMCICCPIVECPTALVLYSWCSFSYCYMFS